MDNSEIGVLLLNLGTPDAANHRAVRNYLKEFLNDPKVVDLPWLVRQVLLRLIILPFRTRRSTHAYQQIWHPEKGSPLLFHSSQLTKALQKKLGENFHIVLGMRYGKPSITQAVNQLLTKKCQKIIIIPLYPQYSSAATESSIEKTLQELSAKRDLPPVVVRQQFYDDPTYISSQAKILSSYLSGGQTEKIIFSYHSLPVRQVKKIKANCSQTCFQHHPCPDVTTQNALCYRAQCYKTSELVAQSLGLSRDRYAVAFQSRLGRAEWIGPDTQKIMEKFLAEGVEKLIVTCPSFVADCLETLEEIGMRGKEQWVAMGGKAFQLVPCLNDHPLWVESLARYITQA